MARCCDGGQVYTLGPQPDSRIERNHLMNYHGGTRTDSKGNRQDPNAIYHDNGSGGWTDTQNVIEGNYEHYCGACAHSARLLATHGHSASRSPAYNMTGKLIASVCLNRRKLASRLRLLAAELLQDLSLELPRCPRQATQLQSQFHGQLVVQHIHRRARAVRCHCGKPGHGNHQRDPRHGATTSSGGSRHEGWATSVTPSPIERLNEATRMHQLDHFDECISSVETFVPPAVVRSSRLLLSAYRRSLPPWRRAVGSRLPPRVSCLSAGSEREARPKPHSFHTDGHQHFATFMY